MCRAKISLVLPAFSGLVENISGEDFKHLLWANEVPDWLVDLKRRRTIENPIFFKALFQTWKTVFHRWACPRQESVDRALIFAVPRGRRALIGSNGLKPV